MKNKQDEKLLTPGNIILGIIILALIGSLFFDFFGGSSEPLNFDCPRAIDDLIITNIIYAANNEPMLNNRVLKPKFDENINYSLSALLRNVGEDEVVISRLGLTKENLGTLELIDVELETIPGKSMKTIEISIPSGEYHKIDLYTDDPCEGNTVWHESGEGSKYAWELEAEMNASINNTEEVTDNLEITEPEVVSNETEQ